MGIYKFSLSIIFAHTVSEGRAVDPDFASGYKVMFSDQYPFLLLSQVSQVIYYFQEIFA